MSFKKWIAGLRAGAEAEAARATAAGLQSSALALDEPARWGRRAFWLGGGAFLLWAFLAPLGQGVPAHGMVKVDGQRKTLQHPRGGVVEEILVREGDKVAAGQPLLRLNESQAQAQHGVVDAQLISLLAAEARLQAERLGAANMVLPAFLQSRKADPEVAEVLQVQRHLFATRQAALNGELSIIQENIRGLQEMLQGLDQQEKSRAEQLRLFAEELAALKPLAEQGFVPRNKLFEVERAVAMVSGQRSEAVAAIGRTRSQVSELKLKALQSRETYRKEVETQLTDVQRQIADYRERRIATQDELERVVLRAPVDGTIVDLSVHTVGGVVQAGQKILDVVPAEQVLVVEAKIPPHLIDSVRVGQSADVHFLALDQTVVPAIPGVLTYVSADTIVDPRTDLAYFVGRVIPSDEGMKKLGDKAIQPGMPADVVIKTGERTFIGYLLKPLLNRLHFALTER